MEPIGLYRITAVRLLTLDKCMLDKAGRTEEEVALQIPRQELQIGSRGDNDCTIGAINPTSTFAS